MKHKNSNNQISGFKLNTRTGVEHKQIPIPSMRPHLVKPKNITPKPPPIIIPLGRTNENVVATPGVRNYSSLTKNSSLLQTKLPPLTPHAHILVDILPFIQRIDLNTKYELVEMVISDNFEEDQEIKKKTETLSNILKLMNDPIYRYGVPIDVFTAIFNLASAHIFRNSIRPQDRNEFSEVKLIFRITNWEHLKICHQIIRALMLDHNAFVALLTPDFCKSLVSSLDTPVTEEQNQFEETIKLIIESYIGQRHDILHYMTNKVIAYYDNVNQYSSIASILRLFFAYYTSLQPPLKQSAFLTFRTVFYPLYSTPYAYNFEQPLSELSLFFQIQDPATTFWCLKYLHMHWPKTNPKKSLVFLNQLTNLLPYLPEAVFAMSAPLIIQMFSSAISSPHVSTCVNAIIYCDNEQFLHAFKNVPQLIVQYLIPAVTSAKDIWKKDARELASQLLQKLSMFERSKQTKEIQPRKDVIPIWGQIAQIASTQDEIFKDWSCNNMFL